MARFMIHYGVLFEKRVSTPEDGVWREQEMRKVKWLAMVLMAAGVMLACNKITEKSPAPSSTPPPPPSYTIYELVPGRVVAVRAAKYDFTMDPSPSTALNDGIAEVGRGYDIKGVTAITRKFGYGSVTEEVILVVEPKTDVGNSAAADGNK